MGFLDKLFGKSKIKNEPFEPNKEVVNSGGHEINAPLNNKVTEVLNRSIKEMTGLDGPFKANASLFDLGMDSLDVLEITMDLEEQLDIEILDSEVENLHTYGEAVRFLSSLIGEPYTQETTEETVEKTAEITEEYEEPVTENVDNTGPAYLITDAKDMSQASRIEASMETIQYQGGDVEAFYREMSLDLIRRHGPLVGVDYMSHFPKFEIYFAYEDGMRIYSGERTGNVDINFLTLGYFGEGPRYAQQFLHAAGFELSSDQINSIEPGDSLELVEGKVKIVKKADKVVEDDMGEVKFLRERNEISFGTPAIYRHYSAPDKEAAKKFLDKQNITAQSYFVVVETPEGIIAKDRMGVFEQ